MSFDVHKQLSFEGVGNGVGKGEGGGRLLVGCAARLVKPIPVFQTKFRKFEKPVADLTTKIFLNFWAS